MAPAAPPHPALLLHDAVALSGRFPLLAGVDLEVPSGQTVLVEGPNGAGKTSLLRVCAGLVPLASGRVTVLGLDPLRHRNDVRRRVGLLSHASHLYEDLTVRENVRFAVRAAGGTPVGSTRLRAVGPHRSPAQDQCLEAVGRTASPGGPGRAGGAAARTVAPRRAPRRARRRGRDVLKQLIAEAAGPAPP